MQIKKSVPRETGFPNLCTHTAGSDTPPAGAGGILA